MIAMAPSDPIPWTQRAQPLGRATVASSAWPTNRQRAVLRATLDALRDTAAPGTVIHLPFEWPESPPRCAGIPKGPSPIIQLLAGDPSLFQRLAAGDIPPEASRRNRERTPS